MSETKYRVNINDVETFEQLHECVKAIVESISGTDRIEISESRLGDYVHLQAIAEEEQA